MKQVTTNTDSIAPKVQQPVFYKPVVTQQPVMPPPELKFSKTYKYADWETLLNVKTYGNFSSASKSNIYTGYTPNKVGNLRQDFKNNSYDNVVNNILLGGIILIFILLANIKVNFSRYLNQILRATFTYSEENKLYRDHNALVDRVYFILNIIFILTGGIYCLLIFKLNNPVLYAASPYKIVFGSILVILALYIFKYLINKILGFILNQQKVFNEYLHSIFIYFKVTGIILLPIISIASFISSPADKVFLYIGLAIIILIYISSIFRASRIMLQKDVLLFYWILYLCTVEFLPYVLLYKIYHNIV